MLINIFQSAVNCPCTSAEILFFGFVKPVIAYTKYLKTLIKYFSEKQKSFGNPNISETYFLNFSDPYGNRTHDSTVKGWRLNPLTNGPL